MRISLPLSLPALLLLVLISNTGLAQDVRYVSDKQYVPLRSGAGNSYRIVHRGIPSGTRLTVAQTSSDGEWAEITTEKGTSGWIRAQYLMREVPAKLQLQAATKRAEKATERSAAQAVEVTALQTERAELADQITNSDSSVNALSSELTQLKQISGRAVELDKNNRNLVVATETLRSEVEMLQSENQRLQDKVQSEDFLNGALAVLLGVVIALVAPRLIPKRRKNSGWA